MSEEKIENLLKGAGLAFQKLEECKWKITLPGRNATAFLEWLKVREGRPTTLLKVYTPVGKLPPEAGVDFFKDIFRKNRDMGHGAFAIMDKDVAAFVDTLELETCAQDEMDATVAWLMKAEAVFREKLDHSKLPYLDAY